MPPRQASHSCGAACARAREHALPPLCSGGRRNREAAPSREILPQTSPPPQNAERISPERRAAELPRCEREAVARAQACALPSLARAGGLMASERERERLAADGRPDGRTLAANLFGYQEVPMLGSHERAEAAAAAAERRAANSFGRRAVFGAVAQVVPAGARGRVAHRGAGPEKRRQRELRREAEGATSAIPAAAVPAGAWFRPEFARLMMRTLAHEGHLFASD